MAAKESMAIRDDAVIFFILEWTITTIETCFERNTVVLIVEALLKHDIM